jgi:Flp pilus assembly pilin Flp
LDRFLTFLNSETGASAAEYALILAVISLAVVGGLTLVGSAINNSLTVSAHSM